MTMEKVPSLTIDRISHNPFAIHTDGYINDVMWLLFVLFGRTMASGF